MVRTTLTNDSRCGGFQKASCPCFFLTIDPDSRLAVLFCPI
jgi:hypothetical protein